MRRLRGFREIAGYYDGFVLDLWGVVHDGVRPYEGAPACLAALAAAGKRCVMLSNAPRRAGVVREQLRGMGIPDGHYVGIMTSGEATHAVLRDRPDAWHRALGDRVLHIGPERDRGVYADLGLTTVADPAHAGFVLNTGPDDLGDPSDAAAYEPVLRACAAAGLPMICANPDLEVIRGGVRVICAGTLAARYAELGGDVRSLGKPDPAIYAPTLAVLDVEPGRVLAVGDALRTDIAGAAAAGLDACWVLGGLHGAHLGGDDGAAEAARAGLRPLATLPAFAW